MTPKEKPAMTPVNEKAEARHRYARALRGERRDLAPAPRAHGDRRTRRRRARGQVQRREIREQLR